MKLIAALPALFCASVLATGAPLLKITSADHSTTSLTVYDSFALVRDVRRAVLPIGLIQLEYERVAQTVEPTSVRVVSLTADNGVRVLEQVYRFDLLNRQSLLEQYIGKKLKYSRSVLQGSQYEKVLREGILLSVGPEIVQFGDEVEIDPEGTISLPYIPADLKTIPTLIWKVDNRIRGSQEIATSYMASGISWRADYTLVLNSTETNFDLESWINVVNQSGVDFDDTAIAVVAGQVRRQVEAPISTGLYKMRTMEAAMDNQVVPAPLSDYYLYPLPGTYDVHKNESHQLNLMSAERVPVTKSYYLETPAAMYQQPQPMTNHFDIRYSFVNVERDQLGTPLPSGKVRVLLVDKGGIPRFLGEDTLPHTPAGESVQLTVGKAFDLVTDRTQTTFRASDRAMETGYEIVVRNRKKEKVTLVLHEKFAGNWTIISQTESGKRIDSTTQEYVLQLDAGATRTFSYLVRLTF
jgi:hypothetical protein